VSESPAGTVTALIRPSDYRRVGSLLLPHHAETEVLGQKRVLTVHSIEQNVTLPANRFDPPADVQKLIDAKQRSSRRGAGRRGPGGRHRAPRTWCTRRAPIGYGMSSSFAERVPKRLVTRAK